MKLFINKSHLEKQFSANLHPDNFHLNTSNMKKQSRRFFSAQLFVCLRDNVFERKKFTNKNLLTVQNMPKIQLLKHSKEIPTQSQQ